MTAVLISAAIWTIAAVGWVYVAGYRQSDRWFLPVGMLLTTVYVIAGVSFCAFLLRWILLWETA